jgi:hypothetical protein
VPRANELPTVEERRAATENARREARFHFAEARIRKIVAGAPAFTEEQRTKLRALIEAS